MKAHVFIQRGCWSASSNNGWLLFNISLRFANMLFVNFCLWNGHKGTGL